MKGRKSARGYQCSRAQWSILMSSESRSKLCASSALQLPGAAGLFERAAQLHDSAPLARVRCAFWLCAGVTKWV